MRFTPGPSGSGVIFGKHHDAVAGRKGDGLPVAGVEPDAVIGPGVRGGGDAPPAEGRFRAAARTSRCRNGPPPTGETGRRRAAVPPGRSDVGGRAQAHGLDACGRTRQFRVAQGRGRQFAHLDHLFDQTFQLPAGVLHLVVHLL